MRDERPGVLLWIMGAVGVVILAAPTLVLVPMSLTGGTTLAFPPRGISPQWYIAFFTEGYWLTAAGNSLVIAVLTMACSVTLGVPIAMSLARSRYRGLGITNALVLGPLLVPGVITAIAMLSALSFLGFTRTFAGLVIAHTVLALPLVVITVLASAQTLDGSTERAAASLGANRWNVFRHAVVPPLVPAIAVAAVYGFVTSWDEMIVSLFITGPTFSTLPVFMWNQVRATADPTTAAVSTMLVALSTFILILAFVVASARRKQKAQQ